MTDNVKEADNASVIYIYVWNAFTAVLSPLEHLPS